MGLALIATVAPAQSQDASTASCGDEASFVNPRDFRLRYSTSRLTGQFEDGKVNHLDPAMEWMDAGRFSEFELRHIDFLLQRWPNHYLALQALIRFERGGGRASPTKPAVCYFELAHMFAPKDANVLILQGIYFHGQNDEEMTERSWQEALAIDPDSADAHYNLGLLYFNTERFDASLHHATAAYNAGYPLPGLRNKLRRAGHWHNATSQ